MIQLLASIVQESSKETNVKGTVIRQDGVQLPTIGVSDRDKSARPHTSSYTPSCNNVPDVRVAETFSTTDRETDRQTNGQTDSVEDAA